MKISLPTVSDKYLKSLLKEVGVRPQIILTYKQDKTANYQSYNTLKQNNVNFFSVLEVDETNKVSVKYSTDNFNTLSEYINNSGKDRIVSHYSVNLNNKEISCPVTLAEAVYLHLMSCIENKKQSSFVQILTA